MKYLDFLYKSKKADPKFLELYYNKLAEFNPKLAEKKMKREKIPLQVVLKTALDHKMDDISCMVYSRVGTSEKAVPILLGNIQANIEDYDLEGLEANLKRLTDSLASISLEDEFFEVRGLKIIKKMGVLTKIEKVEKFDFDVFL